MPSGSVSLTLPRMFSLAGKYAVVTGAGSGIGKAIALALAKQGAFVDVLEVNVEAANDTVEQRLLELELAEIEAHWKEEEELASIIDGELTPLPLLESIRRRVAGVG